MPPLHTRPAPAQACAAAAVACDDAGCAPTSADAPAATGSAATVATSSSSDGASTSAPLCAHDGGQAAAVTPAHARGHRRRVSWSDAAPAGHLCTLRLFYQDEEVWRVGTRCSPLRLEGVELPSPPRAPSPPPLVAFDSRCLPGTEADMMAALAAHAVQLESVLVRAPSCFLTVRVLNLAFGKDVFLRVTSDGWRTFRDVPASFGNCVSSTTERFFAAVAVPSYEPGAAIEFAVGYRVNNQEFWDSNGGRNYRVEVPQSKQ